MKFLTNLTNFFKNLFSKKKITEEKYEKNETVETKKVEETVVIFSPSVFKIDTLETPVVEVIEEKKEIFVEEVIKEETKQEETIKLQDAIAPKQEIIKEVKPSEPAVKDEQKKKKKEFKSEKSKQVKSDKKTEKVEKSEPAKKSKPKK